MRLSAGAFAHLAEASMEFLISRTMGYLSNAAGYYDDSFTQTVTTAATEPDAARRKQLYAQISDKLLDAAYIQVLSPFPDIMIYRSNVQGMLYEQASSIPFRNVWLS
jgi:ABC-type transport system substrate-binding protein